MLDQKRLLAGIEPLRELERGSIHLYDNGVMVLKAVSVHTLTRKNGLSYALSPL